MSEQGEKLSSFLERFEEKERFLDIIERYLNSPPITRTFNTKATKSTAELGWNMLVELSTGVPLTELEDILCKNQRSMTPATPAQKKLKNVMRTHPAFLSSRQ